MIFRLASTKLGHAIDPDDTRRAFVMDVDSDNIEIRTFPDGQTSLILSEEKAVTRDRRGVVWSMIILENESTYRRVGRQEYLNMRRCTG